MGDFKEARSTSVDRQSLGDMEVRTVFLFVVSEEIIPLSDQVDQVLQLVWNCKIPHGCAQDSSIGALEPTMSD